MCSGKSCKWWDHAHRKCEVRRHLQRGFCLMRRHAHSLSLSLCFSLINCSLLLAISCYSCPSCGLFSWHWLSHESLFTLFYYFGFSFDVKVQKYVCVCVCGRVCPAMAVARWPRVRANNTNYQRISAMHQDMAGCAWQGCRCNCLPPTLHIQRNIYIYINTCIYTHIYMRLSASNTDADVPFVCMCLFLTICSFNWHSDPPPTFWPSNVNPLYNFNWRFSYWNVAFATLLDQYPKADTIGILT